MPSVRARLFNLVLPLLGFRAFFSDPRRLDERIARLRRKKQAAPRLKWSRRFRIGEDRSSGFTVFTFTPRGGVDGDAPHLLYFHGGAYVVDANPAHFDVVARLCDMLGASASVPLYPLAPEVTADVTLPAMRNLYDELVEKHGAGRLTVIGDSAGGGIALALVQALRDDEAAMPASLVLYSPWLDVTVSDPAQPAIEPKDKILAIAGLMACGKMYAGRAGPSDPRVSPLFGSLEQLPPMAVFAGTHDILLPDARRLAKALGGSDPQDFSYREYEGMVHVWMLSPIPEARRTLEETVQFIRRACAQKG